MCKSIADQTRAIDVWCSIMKIILTGKPYPQPRVQVGKFGSYYSKKHKVKSKETLLQIISQVNYYGWQVSDKPIRIDITTVTSCPQRLKKQVVSKGKRLYKPTIPDIDNYTKYILDCITKSKRIWIDDKQVVELHQKDFYGAIGENPFTEIIIQELDLEG